MYACISKGGVNGDAYVKFDISEFMTPMSGLTDLSTFPEKVDNPRHIPTTLDLLGTNDIPSFASLHALNEVPSDVASQTARPPTIILLSGEVYHGLVTSIYELGQDYGFCCGVLDALDYIQSVAKKDDQPERNNPLVYSLMAISQLHNPSIPDLFEISVALHADVSLRQRFAGTPAPASPTGISLY